jgi:hypothetical protein
LQDLHKLDNYYKYLLKNNIKGNIISEK